MIQTRSVLVPLLMAVSLGCAARPAGGPADVPAVAAVPLPDGAPGIGFDDLHFSTTYGVLAPGGRSGRLDFVDAATRQVSSMTGFSVSAKYDGGHDTGVTSADEGLGLLFATDRDTKTLAVIEHGTHAIALSVPLAAGPDYVRLVAPTGELWVTEPDAEQIEVFSLDASAPPKVARAALIKVPRGPESLVIDAVRGRAYANGWKSETFAIDLKTRAVVATWRNACKKSRGLALDAAGGFLFIGCGEGGAVALDVTTGQQVGASPSGEGVDIIDYSPTLRHLYVPGGKAQTMAIFAVSTKGWLTPLGTVPTAPHAHCVATDDRGTAFVCDPDHGQLLAIHDPYVASQ